MRNYLRRSTYVDRKFKTGRFLRTDYVTIITNKFEVFNQLRILLIIINIVIIIMVVLRIIMINITVIIMTMI